MTTSPPIILHDVAPEKTPFTLTTNDGSIYRLKSLKPDPQNLQADDASLGHIAIPLGTLRAVARAITRPLRRLRLSGPAPPALPRLKRTGRRNHPEAGLVT